MRRTERAEEIFARLERANPSPKGELDHVNPYTLLVAVVLSAQATDKGVNRATAALFRQVTTPQEMLDLGEEGLIGHIKSIGLFRAKARNVIKLSRDLIDHHGGEVPQTREELETLPGVGRKTANVVLNMAFGQPTMAVDTHVFRVSQRLGLARGKTPLAIEEQLVRAVPARFMQHAHHWLILHGRYTCLARSPRCATCPVEDLCSFKGKSKPAPAEPRPGKRAPRKPK